MGKKERVKKLKISPTLELPDFIQHKLISVENINDLFHPEYRKNHTIVFTNGCFDMLHRGHIHLLSSARAMGDTLVIGLNTDESVRNLKGSSRPVKDQVTRAAILASMEFVNYVILFNDPTPIDLIREVRPDILVKGGDYREEEIVGYDIVSSYGGKVTTIPFLEGFSSTSLINKIGQG